MLVVVPVKAVPLHAPVVRIGDPGGLVEPAELRLDPINEVSLAWALQMREAGAVDDVLAVSVGTGSADGALRAALARGCTDAVRIAPEGDSQPGVLDVAELLAEVGRRRDASVIAFGYESYDASSGVVPAATAGLLRWPIVSRARTAALRDGRLVATRARASGTTTAEVALPAVVSFVEGELLPRNPRLADELAARRRSIPMLSCADLVTGDVGSAWTDGIERLESAPRRERRTRVLGVDDGVEAVLALASDLRTSGRTLG